MNFLIYGAGSLGLLFARYLSKKYGVDVIAKPKRKEFLDKDNLVFIKDGRKEKVSLNVYSNVNDLKNDPDIIILAVKSFDIDESLNDILGVFRNKHVVTVQNGVYAEKSASKALGGEYILPAYVMIGAKTIDERTIEEFLNSGMKIGYIRERSKEKAKRFSDALNSCGINCVLSDKIMKEKWHKMMFYCAGAALNSLTGTKNLENENVNWMVRDMLNEIAIVMDRLNFNFNSQELADDVYKFLMSFKPEKWSASVGEDLRKGKKTEIDYLNGYIVNLAKEFEIDVPLNRAVFSIVKTIENTKYFASV